jgi:predicted amidohydrolase
MNSGEDVADNLVVAEELLNEAADGGADLAALPELFPFLAAAGRLAEVAEPLAGGPISQMLSRVARERSLWVLGGSLAERGEHGGIHNTSPLLDRSGELVARYRKIHLFDVELPGQPVFRESATFSAGTELVTHETESSRLGLSICYDLRFPELYRGLMALGSEVLLVPAQFQRFTGQAHWHVLVRARAIENQCFVVAPAQWGAHGPPEERRLSFGHSMVVDPWGNVLVEAPEEGTGVWFADLDLGELRRIRQVLPALQHRRLGPAC